MKTLSLIVCLILMAGHQISVTAVTDAELEALEKQIEEQEVDEKKKAEEEVKRKAEERKAELEKQKLEEEQKRFAEEKRKLEKEKRELEEARQTEFERKRQEEARKKAETEKKQAFESIVTQADQALSDKDKELAISKYLEALKLYPDNDVVKLKINQAEKLKHKVCYDVLGWWVNTYKYTIEFNLKEDGSTDSNVVHNPTWSCDNPNEKQIIIDGIGADAPYNKYELRSDNNCLCRVVALEEKKKACSMKGGRFCYIRK